jgi:hypothetical protein
MAISAPPSIGRSLVRGRELHPDASRLPVPTILDIVHAEDGRRSLV